MRAVIALITVAIVAACGADGAPIRPVDKASKLTSNKTSLNISGTARIGVSWKG